MSFLDSLENNLKTLESQDPAGMDENRRRMSDKERALAIAPWADKLKNGPYVKSLMRDLTRAGFERRMKVNFIWLGSTLRAEALEERLELQPLPNGVVAAFDGQTFPVDVQESPDKLMNQWLGLLDKKRAEIQARPAEVFDDGE